MLESVYERRGFENKTVKVKDANEAVAIMRKNRVKKMLWSKSNRRKNGTYLVHILIQIKEGML